MKIYENVINQKHLLSSSSLLCWSLKQIKSNIFIRKTIFSIESLMLKTLMLFSAFIFGMASRPMILSSPLKKNSLMFSEKLIRAGSILHGAEHHKGNAKGTSVNIKHLLMVIWSFLIYYEWTNGMLSKSCRPFRSQSFHQRCEKQVKIAFNVVSLLHSFLPFSSRLGKLKFLRDDFYLHVILHNELFMGKKFSFAIFHPTFARLF